MRVVGDGGGGGDRVHCGAGLKGGGAGTLAASTLCGTVSWAKGHGLST